MRVKRFSFKQIGNGERVPWHVLLVLPSSLFVYFQTKICGSTFFWIIPSAGLTKKAPIATTYGISGQGNMKQWQFCCLLLFLRILFLQPIGGSAIRTSQSDVFFFVLGDLTCV